MHNLLKGEIMKYTKSLLAAAMILPWFSVPFLGAKSFKRFLPAAIFINFIVIIDSIIAKKRVWWWFYKKLDPRLRGETPLLWGPFLVGSLWIMKLTYGKIFRYMLLNFFVDSSFVYLILGWLKRLGIVSLVRLEKFQLLLLFLFKAVLLYVFQFIKENREKLN
jgi:hypothetical protein